MNLIKLLKYKLHRTVNGKTPYLGDMNYVHGIISNGQNKTLLYIEQLLGYDPRVPHEERRRSSNMSILAAFSNSQNVCVYIAHMFVETKKLRSFCVLLHRISFCNDDLDSVLSNKSVNLLVSYLKKCT